MKKLDLKEKKTIHFIGLGGIGMSGIASILLELGHTISGSDLNNNNLLEKLKAKGADVFIGHKASNLNNSADFVVYTSCIKETNPEILKAKSLDIPILHRQTLLAALMREKKGIAVTGAHGKSTTTALIGTILLRAGLDPTIVVGAEVADFGGNARLGKSEFFIAEADESDGSFIELEPYYAVITNIDREHLDHYKSIANIIKTNKTFINRIKKGGELFCLREGEYTAKLLDGRARRYKTFGFSPEADIYASDLKVEGLATTFKCVYNNKDLGVFKLMLLGRHNVLNALAALSVALELGVKPSIIKKAFSNYKGASRRFEIKGRHRDIFVIEDYAHHPTEIEVTLQACRAWSKKRIISIFQPHRFSRTKFLAYEFAKAFKLTDELILTDIYSASEKSIEGISTKLIFDRLKKDGKNNVQLLPKERIVEYLSPRVKKGDVILVLGAGDIGEISEKIAEKIKTQTR